MTWVKWKLVSVHFEIVLISIQDWCMVCTERTIGLEIVGMHMMALLADVFKWRLISVCLEIVLTLTQDSAWFAPNAL